MRHYIAFFAILLINTNLAYAFDDQSTHPEITKKAAEISIIKSYLPSNFGDIFKQGLDSVINGKSVLSWLQTGSTAEDSPWCRASNHFHNPLKSWDQSYMSDDTTTLGSLIREYCDSTGWPYSSRKSNVTWGTGYLSPAPAGSKTSISAQEYDWDDARAYYYQALTSGSSNDRETYFSKTFQALGQVVHLIEDMAVPAHVRNDFTAHLYLVDVGLSWPTSWFGNPFEDYVKDHPEVVSGYEAISDTTNLPITRFWDTDTYNGSNPPSDLSVGLAEYTNANFFSDTTIFTESKDSSDAHYFPHPSKNETNAQAAEVEAEDGGTDKVYYVYKTGSSYKLAAYSYFNYLLAADDWEYNLDDDVHKDYAGQIIPKAVGYSAGLLNYFFRGQINMEEDSDNPGQYIIKNESGERMEGTFTLYYDDTGDNRREVANWSLSINANDKSSPVSFTPPTSPEPKEYGEYMLVFNGKLGNEEGAVVGREITDPTSYGRVVLVSNSGSSRGTITVYTKKGEITAQLPSTGLSEVRSVRFDVDDWNTFVVMAVYDDNNDATCKNGCYKFHKYSIDENALSLNYQGVVLQEGQYAKLEETMEKIFERWLSDMGEEGEYQQWWEGQENLEYLYYVDFFLKGNDIKPFGVISETNITYLDEVFATCDTCGGDPERSFMSYKKTSKLYYGGVVQEITPIDCQGGYFYLDEYGNLRTEACQPRGQKDAYLFPWGIFNGSDYAYAYFEAPDPWNWHYGYTSPVFKEVISTLPITMPQTYLKTILREDGKYSFYTSYTVSPKSYSSEIGTADCSGFLISATQVGDGYLGWQSSGKIVSFENCSDWQSLGRTGSSGSDNDKFDVILNYQP